MKNELLAPNGKPSNLNATQYKLVRTPAFKNWFGDWENDPANSSKVVDENGEPLVVYHRTKTKFYEFNSGSNLIGWLGRGFYFSPNKNEFKEYGRSVLSCFLNIKNLFVSKGEDDGYLFSEVKSMNKSNVFNEIDISQTLKENGYNGVLLKHWDRGVIINCFEPNQIKLADGTNTEFDSSSNDIRFDMGGTILLAPNGKRSNLNAEQYKLVRTPAFKKWFGDWENDPANASKVVDRNGEPLVVYHGTNTDFTIFSLEKVGSNVDYGMWGSGFYFSPLRSFSKNYGSRLLKLFLNIRNPFVKNPNIQGSKSQFKPVYGKEASLNLRNEILSYNYDGVLQFESGEKNPLTQIIAFEPNQIKLADGTNLTFDSENDDIRFERGGELKAEDMLKHPLTIKRLQDLDDNDGYWVNQYHAKTKNYKPNTYYHLNTNSGLNAGVGKGLYLGRDKDALISFYDLEGENKTVDTYVGNPNWFDLMDYADYDRYEQEAIRKYGKNYVSKNSISDIDIRGEMLRKLAIEKGFDGIRYYDPQATGEEFVLFDVKKVKKIDDDFRFKNGGRTVAQTPAPKKDRVYGSDLNKNNSSKSVSSAKMIKFDENTLEAIKNKVQTHNEQYPDKKINLSSAKAVVRRGMGAYSSSHRPTISGGKPNSRVAWGLARLNAFTYKIVNGKSKSGKYSQDDDLIEELGFKVADYKNGGEMSKDIRCINCGWEWDRKDSELWDMYVCHKCGFDNTSFYTSDPINQLLKGGRLNSNKGVNPEYLKMFLGK
jgi:hypothetical protein